MIYRDRPIKDPVKQSEADLWQDLAAEFAYEGVDNDQLEQRLAAITETWMRCTGELLGLPVQLPLAHQS